MSTPNLVVADAPAPAGPPVSIEDLLCAVDRHIDNILGGELAPVFAECGGPGRAQLVRMFARLPTVFDGAFIECVSRRADGFAVRIRYECRAMALVLTTTWVADAKKRLTIVDATSDTRAARTGLPGDVVIQPTVSACA